MTIDDLARAAATDARRTAVRHIDPATSLRQLHRIRRNRTRLSIVAAMAAAVAFLAGAGALMTNDRTANPVNRPASSPTPTDSGPCADRAIRCLGGGRFRVALTVPVTVTLPANFQGAFSTRRKDLLEDYRNDIETTGVSVGENAIPVRDDASWARDPAAGATAASVARWLATRPFLVHAALTPTSVGGLRAWRVSGQLKPGAALPALKNGSRMVAPTFKSAMDSNSNAGYATDLTGEYTLLDVKGAGVTVIWSWTQGHGTRALAGNQAYIDGLSFG